MDDTHFPRSLFPRMPHVDGNGNFQREFIACTALISSLNTAFTKMHQARTA